MKRAEQLQKIKPFDKEISYEQYNEPSRDKNNQVIFAGEEQLAHAQKVKYLITTSVGACLCVIFSCEKNTILGHFRRNKLTTERLSIILDFLKNRMNEKDIVCSIIGGSPLTLGEKNGYTNLREFLKEQKIPLHQTYIGDNTLTARWKDKNSRPFNIIYDRVAHEAYSINNASFVNQDDFISDTDSINELSPRLSDMPFVTDQEGYFNRSFKVIDRAHSQK